MRSYKILIAAASALAISPAAYAADVFPGNPSSVPGAFFIVSGNPFLGPVSAAYGRSGIGTGIFTDRFLFTLGDPRGGLGSGSITTVLAGRLRGVTDLDFLNVTFDNGSTVFPVSTGPGTTFGQETGSLTNVPISPGVQNILSVTYRSRGQGSYGGNLTFNPVPEPATWAMMLMGFAGLGMVIRHRRKQQTRVSYAF